MTTAHIVMAALPPTKGHINLIRYAAELANDVVVVVCTQPDEPMAHERYEAVVAACWDDGCVQVRHFHKAVEQDPTTPGFWDMWKEILYYVEPEDYIVASEPYGLRLAEALDCKFLPYDPGREIYFSKATEVRNDPIGNFSLIAEPFQQHLLTQVCIFGAESTGKTTLAKALTRDGRGYFFMEWARPYLEMCGTDITTESMTDIWRGQAALEDHSGGFYDRPLHVFDTDLFSTIGYWQFPHWADTLGPVPQGLIDDAYTADLYIITPSNIPFEEDPLRYGGDKREASDQYWIDVAETWCLNYVVLESVTLEDRVAEAEEHIRKIQAEKCAKIAYDRKGL